MKNYRFTKSASRDLDILRRTNDHIYREVLEQIQGIYDDPLSYKQLVGDLSPLRTCPVKQFRIVFRVGKDSTPVIVAIGDRGKVYERPV